MHDDIAHMRRALDLAVRGRATVSPNPMVGCVIVDPHGTVVGEGHHERAGEPHAEIHALRHAGARARGATMYVTLEPCSHTGRTGPCAVPTADSGIGRVVAAIEDPNPEVSGRGFAYLRARGVAVEVGLLADEAQRLNETFLTSVRLRRPHVTLKVALSADGYMARPGGGPTAITGAEARAHVHAHRAWVDAIAVGSGTMLSDDPLLTARDVERPLPLTRVIFDRRLRTPLFARMWATRHAGPILVMTTNEAMAASPRAVAAVEARGGECVPCRPRDIRDALSALDRRRIRSIILEGGAALHEAAWTAGVVDRFHLYRSPHALGNGVRWKLDGLLAAAARPDVEHVPLGPDILINADVHRPR